MVSGRDLLSRIIGPYSTRRSAIIKLERTYDEKPTLREQYPATGIRLSDRAARPKM
jgi:hypothetical protein